MECSTLNFEAESDASDYDYRLMHAALVESWLDVGLNYENPRMSSSSRGRSFGVKTHKRFRSHSPSLSAFSSSSVGLLRTTSAASVMSTSDNVQDGEATLAVPLSRPDSFLRSVSNSNLGDDVAMSFQQSGDLDEGSDEVDGDENDGTELLELAAFLSMDCSLEKRDGTTSPGSDISMISSNTSLNDAIRVVHGRDATLSKLEQKASLLSVAGRTNVKLGQVHVMRNGYETRSIVKIRVKLISVIYGILLQWKNGLVRYVVLHKMPPDSFMEDDTTAASTPISFSSTPDSSLPNSPLSQSSASPRENHSPSRASKYLYTDMSFHSSSHYDSACTVVMQSRTAQAGGNNETEVTILQPPWLVDRPAEFEKPTLTVTVLRAQGLRNGPLLSSIMPTMQSFVKLNLSEDSHRTGIVKMRGNPIWEDTDNNVALLSVDPSSDRFLKVEICDHKPMKNVKLSVVYVPLALVESKKNDEAAQVTLPCRMRQSAGGGYGSITLSLSLFDPRREWLDLEMRARERASNTKQTNDLNTASCFEKPVLCGVVTGEPTCAIGEEAGEMFTEWFNRWWFC